MANRNIIIKDPGLDELVSVQFSFTVGQPDIIEVIMVMHPVGGEIPDQERRVRIPFSALTASDRNNTKAAIQAALNLAKATLGF